jgi:hypothetical protein
MMSREDILSDVLKSVFRFQDRLILAKADMREDSRRAVKAALSAAIDFISSIPGSDENGLANPLTVLRMALLDLEAGVTPPLLTPSSKLSHRPETPTATKFTKAYAVASVDRLVAAGMKVDEACKFVSAEYRRAKINIGTRTDHWKTVRQWRYELNRRPKERKKRASDDRALYELVEDLNRVLKPGITLEDTKREVREDIATNIADFK